MESAQHRDPERTRDLALVARIRQGDEAAFAELVKRHHAGFTRLAVTWVQDRSVADEVVQETWLFAIERLAEFEGRSSVKTWLCGILINKARNRRRQERHTVPGSSLDGEAGGDQPAVAPDRFSPPGHRWDGHWQAPPSPWPQTPEGSVLTAEMRQLLESSIATLPENQRAVFVLHDVEGLSGQEVCNALGITDTHQRVLLHRARSRLRNLLESHYREEGKRPS
jgi:RNA polymerase sigma-70 factor (ECF subfamily)